MWVCTCRDLITLVKERECLSLKPLRVVSCNRETGKAEGRGLVARCRGRYLGKVLEFCIGDTLLADVGILRYGMVILWFEV